MKGARMLPSIMLEALLPPSPKCFRYLSEFKKTALKRTDQGAGWLSQLSV